MKKLLILALSFLSVICALDASAAVYKCTNGKITGYSQSPIKGLDCVIQSAAAQPVVTKPNEASPTVQVFAPSSFWYQPIPTDVKLHANSDNFAKEFERQRKAYYGTVNINTLEHAAPVFRVGPDVKPVKVLYELCQKEKTWIDPAFVQMMSAVPIPANATMAKGFDMEMSVYSKSADALWETWVTRKDAKGNWSACWGGKLENASKSDGRFKQYYGTTATSLPFIGGQITPAELSAGRIDHVIGISLVDLENWWIYSWPASRSDGYNPKNSPNQIPEGIRLRLDPAVDVDKLPLSKAGKTIARAAQKYGFVVWDKAGAISLRTENPIALGADPYPAFFENRPSYEVLNGFPWNKLQFLPMDYGKP